MNRHSEMVTIVGIICEAIGIYMIFQGTTVPVGTVSYSLAPLVLIIGAILIVVGLATTPRSSTTGPPPERSLWSRIWPIILGIVLLATFIGTHYKFPSEDKYKILVDLILVMVALTAAVGYGIFKWISREVAEQVVKERQLIKESYTLTTAKIRRNVGYMFWSIFDVEQKRKQKSNNNPEDLEYHKSLLKSAIEFARLALKTAQELPTDKDENKKEIYLCMNNLIYFLAEIYKYKFAELELTDKEKEEVLGFVRELLREASKENYPEGFYDCQESSAWALFHLSDEDDIVSKEKAREIIRKLLEDADIPHAWRKDKKKQWKEYFDAL